MRIMRRLVSTATICMALSGCVAAPTRLTTPDAFKVVVSGQVKPAAVQATTDCIMDGFDAASFAMTQGITVRQQRRVGGYRIESMVGPVMVVSADIMDSGKVELLEATGATLAGLGKEQAAVTACIEKFR